MKKLKHRAALCLCLAGLGFLWACRGSEESGSRKADMRNSATEPEVVSLLGMKLFSSPPGEEALKILQDAKNKFDSDPSEDNFVWLGRRTAYLGRYGEALKIYSEGLVKYPQSYRLLRHRGHRYITLRRFEEAVTDLEKAEELVKGKALEIELDGAPNKINKPLSNTQFNILYHLGLAYYLLGKYENAATAYTECLKWSDNSDLNVATTDWLVMTLWRLNKEDEAAKLLSAIREGMTLVENGSYYERLLMYKGLKSPESLLSATGENEDQKNLALATQGYGVGNWYHSQGDEKKAVEIFEKVVAGKSWAAFGYIAAEADLARLRK